MHTKMLNFITRAIFLNVLLIIAPNIVPDIPNIALNIL